MPVLRWSRYGAEARFHKAGHDLRRQPPATSPAARAKRLPTRRLPAPTGYYHSGCTSESDDQVCGDTIRPPAGPSAAPPKATTEFAPTPSDRLPDRRQQECNRGPRQKPLVSPSLCGHRASAILVNSNKESPHGRSWIWKCARSRFHCV